MPGRAARQHGRAVQVDPIKPKLKPPGTKRLKLNCNKLLSASAFKFNLRRYSMEFVQLLLARGADPNVTMKGGRGLHLFPFQLNLSSSVHRITQSNS